MSQPHRYVNCATKVKQITHEVCEAKVKQEKGITPLALKNTGHSGISQPIDGVAVVVKLLFNVLYLGLCVEVLVFKDDTNRCHATLNVLVVMTWTELQRINACFLFELF